MYVTVDHYLLISFSLFIDLLLVKKDHPILLNFDSIDLGLGEHQVQRD